MTKDQRPVHGRAIATVALAVALSACTGSAVTQASLREDPASSLVLPGSRLLGEVGSERKLTPTGPSPAFFGHIFGTAESPGAVRAYFDGEIRALGWVEDARPTLGTTEREGWGWCKSGVRFRLTIVDPQRLASTGISLGSDLPRTVYDASLIASERPCPLPEGTWPPEATG
jgi:hypothetical protein